jgi:hypothetical protein
LKRIQVCSNKEPGPLQKGDDHKNETRCVYETQMPPRVTNSNDSHAYIKAFEK